MTDVLKEHNKGVKSRNDALEGNDPDPDYKRDARDFVKTWRSHQRLVERLDVVHGIGIDYKFPNRYESWMPYVSFQGNTYNIRGLLKRHILGLRALPFG